MRTFAYPMRFKAQAGRGYLASARDLPEVITDGRTLDEAMQAAEGALQAAIEVRIERGEDIAPASDPRRGERVIVVPVSTALKAALHLSVREQGITKAELAKRLAVDEKEARRILDPRSSTKVPTLERALSVVGRRAALSVG